MAWSLAVSECAYGLGGFVVKAGEHFVEVGGAKGEHEPFTGGSGALERRLLREIIGEKLRRCANRTHGIEDRERKKGKGSKRRATHIYGPGRSFIALKQRHVSSTRTGPWI